MDKKLSFSLVGLLLLLLVGCSEIMMEKDISLEKVVVIAPVNDAQFTSTGVTFSWNKLNGAAKYRLQVASPNFSSPRQLVLDTLVSTTSFTHQLVIDDYEWRIKAVNGGYETEFVSQFFSVASNDDFFKIIVVLNSPRQNEITNVVQQNLSWQAVIGATSYDLQIIDATNKVLKSEQITETTWTYDFTEGIYTWKVRADNGTTTTNYASRLITIDVAAPVISALETPVNNATLSENEVTFTWKKDLTKTVSAETDSLYIYKDVSMNQLEHKNKSASGYKHTLDNGVYYWTVKSFDAAGNVSAAITPFKFTLN